jgi:hypothetical protein
MHYVENIPHILEQRSVSTVHDNETATSNVSVDTRKTTVAAIKSRKHGLRMAVGSMKTYMMSHHMLRASCLTQL